MVKHNGESSSVVELKLFVSAPAPTLKSFGSGSSSGSGSGVGSDISFITTFYHRFHIKKWFIHVFMKEYQPNSHAGYNMNFYFYLLLKLTRSQNFVILAPALAPAKRSGSLQLRLHNTGIIH
jgi:hypothetical protein